MVKTNHDHPIYVSVNTIKKAFYTVLIEIDFDYAIMQPYIDSENE